MHPAKPPLRGATPWTATTPLTPEARAGTPAEGRGIEKIVKKSRLGRGGYGEVWLVDYLGQVEAHKYLTKGTGNQQERAFREALNTRRIKHPNIVQIFGVEGTDGSFVLRMEFVPGRDLGRVVDEDGVLPVEHLVPLAMQAADALGAAHACGIVHRDVKPSNFLLREGGKDLVVTDFGISGVLREENAAAEEISESRGHFVSPRESRESSSPRGDIWSLGVTLHYLTTGAMPIGIGETPPVAGERTPLPSPCETWPHVAPEFWEILERMLSDDSEKALNSMAAVRDALDSYHRTAVCPACAGRASLDVIGERCPVSACGKTAIVGRKHAVIERRKAETALCECRFEEASEAFLRAGEAYAETDPELVARLRGLAERARKLHPEHDEAALGVEKLLETGRLVAAARAVHQARQAFSRSSSLLRLRAEIRGRMAALYSGLEESVARQVKQRKFEEARESVNRVDQILGDPIARRELEKALGQPPESFERLYRRVEEKGNLYLALGLKAREHIERCRFDEAIEVYSQLETEFPDPEHLQAIRRLSQAKESFVTATVVEDDQLSDLVAEPQRIAQEENLPLARIAQACAALTSLFPVDEYPSFVRFQETGDRVQALVRALQDYVQARREEAAELGARKHFGEERRVLELAEAVVRRTDVFEEGLRNALRQRSAELDALLARARQSFAEGKAALERNEFTRAVALLEDVASLAPEDFPELGPTSQRALEAKSRLASLGEDFARGLAEIEVGNFTMDSARRTLGTGEEWLCLSDSSQLPQNRKLLAIAAWRLIASQAEHLDPRSDAGIPSTPDFLLQNLVPVAEALPAERWPELFSQSSELRGEVCTLFAHAVARIPDAPEERLDILNELRAVLLRLGDFSRSLAPPHLATHPTVAIAQAASGCAASIEKKHRPATLRKALALSEELRPACAPEAARDLDRVVESLTRQLQGLRLWALVLRIVTSVRVAWSVAACAAAIAAVVFIWKQKELARVYVARYFDGGKDMLEKVSSLESWIEVLMKSTSDKESIEHVPGGLFVGAEEKANGLLSKELKKYAIFKLDTATIALSDWATGSLLTLIERELETASRPVGGLEKLIEGLKSVTEALSDEEPGWAGVRDKVSAVEGLETEVRTSLEKFAAAEFRRRCLESMLERSEIMSRSSGGDLEQEAEEYLTLLDKTFAELQELRDLNLNKIAVSPESGDTERGKLRAALIKAINDILENGESGAQ